MLISLLISLLVLVVVLYIAFWLIGMMGLPEPARRIIVAIVALIGLLYLLRYAGVWGGPVVIR